jgi:hypothetical protein
VGICNSAFGRLALVNNSASYNSAFGCNSLWSNTTGTGNTGTGYYTLNKNTTGSYNIAVGYAAMFNNTTGEYNCAFGYESLYQNTTGSHNSAFGSNSLYYSQASYNSAFGNSALANNTTGGYNTAVGASALTITGTGSHNTAIGYFSGPYITGGIGNTAVGSSTLTYVNVQNYNTAVGYYAGYSRKGNDNTFVGAYADATDENYYNSTALGYQAYITASNQVRIGNYTVTTIGGQVSWTTWSDGRVKKNIKQNVPGLAFINKLNPVTYNLDLDAADKIIQTSPLKDKDGNSIKVPEEFVAARKAKQEIVYTGLIAQEVEKAAKETGYNFSGVDGAKNDHDVYGLRYSDFVMPLIKSVQELSKKNDEKDDKINDLQKQIDELKSLIVANNQVSSATKQQLSSSIAFARLEQNQPNPTSSSTTIKYFIPGQVLNAAIKISNTNGQVIKAVNLSSQKTGQITIQTNDLTAGSYLYSLVANGKIIDTKKMVIFR